MDIILSTVAVMALFATFAYEMGLQKANTSLPNLPPKPFKLLIDACAILQVFAIIAAFTHYRLEMGLLPRIGWLLLSSLQVFATFVFLVPTARDDDR